MCALCAGLSGAAAEVQQPASQQRAAAAASLPAQLEPEPVLQVKRPTGPPPDLCQGETACLCTELLACDTHMGLSPRQHADFSQPAISTVQTAAQWTEADTFASVLITMQVPTLLRGTLQVMMTFTG